MDQFHVSDSFSLINEILRELSDRRRRYICVTFSLLSIDISLAFHNQNHKFKNIIHLTLSSQE